MYCLIDLSQPSPQGQCFLILQKLRGQNLVLLCPCKVVEHTDFGCSGQPATQNPSHCV